MYRPTHTMQTMKGETNRSVSLTHAISNVCVPSPDESVVGLECARVGQPGIQLHPLPSVQVLQPRHTLHVAVRVHPAQLVQDLRKSSQESQSGPTPCPYTSGDPETSHPMGLRKKSVVSKIPRSAVCRTSLRSCPPPHRPHG